MVEKNTFTTEGVLLQDYVCIEDNPSGSHPRCFLKFRCIECGHYFSILDCPHCVADKKHHNICLKCESKCLYEGLDHERNSIAPEGLYRLLFIQRLIQRSSPEQLKIIQEKIHEIFGQGS